MRKQFRDLASLEEARAAVMDLAVEPSQTTVPIDQAGGRIAAETVRAPIDVPGFDRSIMDGYAVQAGDTVGAYDDSPVTLSYSGAVGAGEAPSVTVGPGEAVEIATGAVLPSGADAVVQVERTRRPADDVLVERPVAPAENVMKVGADIPAGTALIRQGDRLDPRRVGLLAAVGVDEVPVFEQPVVGIVSTGREIVRPTDRDELGPAEIFDTNSFSLAAAAEEADGQSTIYPHADEDYESIRATIEEATAGCDLVLSTGSTSASAEDVVYRVVDEAGELLLHGVAIKPGKPTVVGRIDETPVLGLPGNPISALMTFRVFAEPLIRRAAGRPTQRPTQEVAATLATTVDSVEGRTQLLPVGLVESPRRGLLAYPVDKGSGAITSLGDADGYVTVPAQTQYRPAEETATVTLLGRDVTPPDLLVGGEFCHVFDRLIDDVSAGVRWLSAGSVDGVVRLRDGILDAALIELPDDVLDEYTLEAVDRVRGYSRTVGLAFADANRPGRPTEPSTAPATISTHPAGTGLRWHLDEWLTAEVEVHERPSAAGIARSVRDGEVDAGWTTEHAADRHGLSFEPVDQTALDLLVSHERRAKPGVDELIDAIGAQDFEEVLGYDTASNTGATLTSW